MLQKLLFTICLGIFQCSAFGQVGHKAKISAIAINGNGSQVLSASPDGVIVLWNELGEKVRVISASRSVLNRDLGTDVYTTISWHDDNQHFVAGALHAAYWGNVESGQLTSIPISSGISPKGITFSAESKYILCNNMTSGIELRTADSHAKLVRTLPYRGAWDLYPIEDDPESLAVSNVNSGLILTDLNGSTKQEFETLKPATTAISWSGEHLFHINEILEVVSRKRLKILPIKSPVLEAHYMQSGQLITLHQNEVHLWDEKGNSLLEISIETNPSSLAVSPDGTFFLVGFENGAIKMYDSYGAFIQDFL